MLNPDRGLRVGVALLLVSLPLPAGTDDEPVDFNRHVRPILSSQCYACHGPDARARKGDLRFDLREGSLRDLGGYAAIVPGRPEKSELYRRITSGDREEVMPPPKSGKKLSKAQIDVLRRWIEQGAQWQAHWSFIPVQRPAVPPADLAWDRNEIDAFIRARLAAEGLKPSSEADRHTLARRVTLDLTGLPPTPEEVEAFVNDSSPDAYEKMVDQILASPHYGEKVARGWLDLARYADSDGYETDQSRPYAWRFRQWVIDALNRDMPFDQFTIEQIAGDLLPGATVDQKMATGFHRNTLSNREGGADVEAYRVEQGVDRVSTVATTWLGLTVGCARCHDHKYDPITQKEFYELYAFFDSADEVNIDAPLPGEVEPYVRSRPEVERKRAELLRPLEAAIAELQARWESRMRETYARPGQDYRWDRMVEVLGLVWGGGEGGGQLEGISILLADPARRTADEARKLQDYFLRHGSFALPKEFKMLDLPKLSEELQKLASSYPKLSQAPTLRERPQPRRTSVHVRGDFRSPGPEVRPGTPAALQPLRARRRPSRLDLALWLVADENPLTARVTVNRAWQDLFGRGLVETSEDFGIRGEAPTHPELLDWLAAEFKAQGWSLKRLYRLILTSAAYRQGSRLRPDLAARDPRNRLLATQSRLRLPAENIRDASLAAAGVLHRAVGGPSVRPPQPASVTQEGHHNQWVESPGSDRTRRGLYTWIQRTTPFAQTITFDGPDVNRCTSRRDRTNNALQALTLLNDPVFFEAAEALAGRILRESSGGVGERIDFGFHLVLGRGPSERERAVLLRLYRRAVASPMSERSPAVRARARGAKDVSPAEGAAWLTLASTLLNLDEAITRE